ncbi:MAG: hypothetical protein U9N09_05815 [Euryarchaeota archaeon]|nr:hypothetical protein [Euryarchaeota archaeon]
MLTKERYDRQIPLIGADGQERIRDASVFIAGAGGPGSLSARSQSRTLIPSIRAI